MDPSSAPLSPCPTKTSNTVQTLFKHQIANRPACPLSVSLVWLAAWLNECCLSVSLRTNGCGLEINADAFLYWLAIFSLYI